MPGIGDGDVGSQIDVPSDDLSMDWIADASTGSTQLPSPPCYPPAASSSNSSRTTMEDLLSESSYSSAPSPCSSYSYNRADFPLENEIEELMSPSFQWEPSSAASYVSRHDSSRLVQPQSSRRQLRREVRRKTDHLLLLLRLLRELPQAAGADPYKRPRRLMMLDTENILNDKALALVTKGNIIRRVFTTIPTNSFDKVSPQLVKAIGNVSWLLRVSKSYSADDILGEVVVPPIATDEPVLFLIWEQVAKLLKGSPKDKADAAASLVSIACDNDRSRKFIIEEGGVGPLLELVNEGKANAQESAANALGLLGRDPESVKDIIQEGACSVFTSVLREGPMKVQAMVAWAVSELAAHYPKCQDDFKRKGAVWILVGHLAFKTTSRMKAMAAKALCALAKGNSNICRYIVETGSFHCFAVLLEKGTEEVQSNCAIAVMEIARVVERDYDLRRRTSRYGSIAFEQIARMVKQLLRIVQEAGVVDKKLLVPCVVALGCLSRIFLTSEVIGPLLRLLDKQDTDVMLEATVALTKFAETDNYAYKSHCKAIINQGGLMHLVQLVYFGKDVQIPALILLCYVAKHVPDSDELARADVITVLEWASKHSALVQNAILEGLLPETKSKLELYRSRGFLKTVYLS